MRPEARACASLLLALAAVASAGALAGEAPKTPVTSAYGIPGTLPAEQVWTQFLAGSELQRATTALQVINRLFDAEGELDPQACATEQAAVREALAEVPVSIGLWLYGSRCAELSGDRALAEQSEGVLAALLEHALSQRKFARFARPIRVLGENDIYAILDLLGEEVRHQHYEVPVTGRYMRAMATLYNPENGRESTLYFDFLDTFAQLTRELPDMDYPEGRQQFARSLLKGMAGSPAADVASDFWEALLLGDKQERAQRMVDLGAKSRDHAYWLGNMCVLIPELDCAGPGVELLLPFVEEEHAEARLSLAAAYAEGRGLTRDEDAARDLLTAANGALGAPHAEAALQFMLRNLHGDTRLHPLVADTLRKAAKAGEPIASLLVAFDTGDWSRRVPAEALPLLQNAADAGLDGAKGLIGKHYLELGKAAKGLPLLEAAARAGDSTSANALGMAYAMGDPIPRDLAAARRWLTAAAQDGNARAMRLLAMDYQREGGADNILRADRWLTSATLVGDLTAAHELARFLAAEPAGARNPRERAKLMFDALVEEHDSDEARVDLARWYLTADNEMKAPEKAEPLLRTAARKLDEGRLAYVIYTLLGRLPGADEGQAREWLEAGIESSDPKMALPLASGLINAQPAFRDAPRGLSTLERWWEDKQDAAALNELAWARCTSPADDVFSSEESARLGPLLAANEESRDNPARLDTVAACHAAAGDFERAAEVQRGVLETVEPRLGATHPTVAKMRERLELYTAGKRAIEDPAADG